MPVLKNQKHERLKRTHHMSAPNTPPPSASAAHAVGVPRFVRCSGCVHWSGHEYPPAFDLAYCAIFDKHTTGGHGEKCTAWEAPNTQLSDA